MKKIVLLLACFVGFANVANAGEKINLKGVESITICNRKNDPDCMTNHDIKATLAERAALGGLNDDKKENSDTAWCSRKVWRWSKFDYETEIFDCDEHLKTKAPEK